MLAQELIRGAAALRVQHLEKRPLGIELRRVAKLAAWSDCGRRGRASRPKVRPRFCPGSATWRSSAIILSSLSVTALKAISLILSRISRAERGVPGRSIGLMGTRIVSRELHSSTSGMMLGLPE